MTLHLALFDHACSGQQGTNWSWWSTYLDVETLQEFYYGSLPDEHKTALASLQTGEHVSGLVSVGSKWICSYRISDAGLDAGGRGGRYLITCAFLTRKEFERIEIRVLQSTAEEFFRRSTSVRSFPIAPPESLTIELYANESNAAPITTPENNWQGTRRFAGPRALDDAQALICRSGPQDTIQCLFNSDTVEITIRPAAANSPEPSKYSDQTIVASTAKSLAKPGLVRREINRRPKLSARLRSACRSMLRLKVLVFVSLVVSLILGLLWYRRIRAASKAPVKILASDVVTGIWNWRSPQYFREVPITKRTLFDVVTGKQEQQLGEDAWGQIRENPFPSSLKEGQKRVEKVAGPIIRQAMKLPNMSHLTFQFRVVEEKSFNAFCYPGAKIVVNRGVLDAVHNDDELAFVLAHEIAHAVGHHSGETLTIRALERNGLTHAELLAAWAKQLGVLGNKGATNILVALNVGTDLMVRLPHSRVMEAEADRIGVYLMKLAGYKATAAGELWERVLEASKSPRSTIPLMLDRYLGDHPPNADRVEQLRQWATSKDP